MKIVPRTNKKESIFLSLRSVRFGFYDAIRDPRKGLAKTGFDFLVVDQWCSDYTEIPAIWGHKLTFISEYT